MKRFLFSVMVSGVFTAVFALDAPYLISATAQSDTSVMLSWRNNSTAYTEIVLLRKPDGSDGFEAIAAAAGNSSSYLDTSLAPALPYTYALIAIADADTSDTSNAVTATATKSCDITIENWQTEGYGHIISLWPTWDNDLKQVRVEYKDKVCNEHGVIIFRDDGDSIYRVIDTVFHTDPFDTSLCVLVDSTCEINQLYFYKVALFNDTVLQMQNGGSIFTYDPAALFITDRYRISTVDKLGESPAYYSETASWVIKAGDTLLVKESNTDSLTYTLIGVSNPEQPIFIGYRHTGPVVSATSECFVDGTRLFIYSGSDTNGSLIYYSYNDGGFEPKDTLTGKVAGVAGKLNDSTLLTGCDYIRTITIHDSGYGKASSAEHYAREVETIYGTSYHRILGLIDHFLFIESKSVDPGSTNYWVLIYSENHDPPYSFPLSQVAFPAMIDGYITTDTIFSDAKHVFLDTMKQYAYIFGKDSIMRIYSYNLDPATITDLPIATTNERPLSGNKMAGKTPTVISDYRNLSYPVFIAIYDISGRMTFKGEIRNKSAFRRLTAKLRPGVYAVRVDDNELASGRKKTVFTLHNSTVR